MTGERRVRKRSKWLQSTTSSAPSSSSASMSHHFNKDSTFLKRIVTEVIAERDAQIAAALFEVAKNQPHLQMMVQTVRPDLPLIFFLSFYIHSTCFRHASHYGKSDTLCRETHVFIAFLNVSEVIEKLERERRTLFNTKRRASPSG